MQLFSGQKVSKGKKLTYWRSVEQKYKKNNNKAKNHRIGKKSYITKSKLCSNKKSPIWMDKSVQLV